MDWSLKYWWRPAALSFGPMFIFIAPELVAGTLFAVPMALIGVGLQTAVNLHLFRRIEEADAKIRKLEGGE